jgi:hypothetical protein
LPDLPPFFSTTKLKHLNYEKCGLLVCVCAASAAFAGRPAALRVLPLLVGIRRRRCRCFFFLLTFFFCCFLFPAEERNYN